MTELYIAESTWKITLINYITLDKSLDLGDSQFLYL